MEKIKDFKEANQSSVLTTKESLMSNNQLKAIESYITTNKETSMQAPKFSNDLVLRKLQYQSYLVANDLCTIDEVIEMDMRTLRQHIDEALPLVIKVQTAHSNGGVTTHYITKKAA